MLQQQQNELADMWQTVGELVAVRLQALEVASAAGQTMPITTICVPS